MSGTLISTFYNGDTTTNSLTAIQQTLLRLYRSHDAVIFGGFVPGNTDAPNVLAGSSVVVNMSFYQYSTAEAITLLNNDGSSSALSSASAGDYYLIAVPNADKSLSIYARAKSAVTVTGNANYSGWYITGTQYRVLGGFSKTSGGTYINKWKYRPYNFGAYIPGIREHREYIEGLIDNIYRNKSVYTLYSDTSTTTHTATYTAIIPALEITHPAKLHYSITAHVSNNSALSSAPKGAGGAIIVMYLDDSENEIAEYDRFTLSLIAAEETKPYIRDIAPGKYRVYFQSSASSGSVKIANTGTSHSGSTTTTYTTYTYNNYLITTSVNIYIRDILGCAIDGTY